jgi:uncharacterized protein (DUF1800 family)
MSDPAAVSRRAFFKNILPSSTNGQSNRRSASRTLSTGLEPFVPDATHPWDALRAGHLLRRTMMMPTWTDIQALVALGEPGKAVDQILNATNIPTPPSMANHATESLATANGNQVLIGQRISEWSSDAAALRAWWEALLLNAQTSLQEKMVVFWSGHFTSQFALGEKDYVVAPLLYRQNKLLRDHALGNFRDLVRGITLDGAMLVFLGGNQNTAGKPNENYARELMELFTCGLGQYSEGDVQEAARILTGWRVKMFIDQEAPGNVFDVYFNPPDHDTNAKTYLQTTFAAIDTPSNTQDLVKENEIYKMIDVLLTGDQTGSRQQAIAKFICRKLYRFFVYSSPTATDENVITAMADLFVQNNFEIKPVMSALLKSAHFFDNANIGCQIKTPAEYIIGMTRQLAPTYKIDGNMTGAGQQFFQPPDVSGWKGYHDWITTNTYPVRGTESTAAIAAIDDTTAIAFVKQFTNYSDADVLATSIGQLLLPRPLSTERHDTFVKKLTNNAPAYEWPNILGNPSTAATYIRNLLTYITSLPDFELC